MLCYVMLCYVMLCVKKKKKKKLITKKRTWRHVWILARWYMAEGRFVARSVSRSQRFKQRASRVL